MLRKALVAVVMLAVAGQALAGTPRWERELREMSYLFLHLSNINVINGVNLSREQAVKLYRLAKQVEAASPRPPSSKAPIRRELEPVRTTWLEARGILVKGEEVPEELRNRVNQAREAESKVIRAMIRPKPLRADTRCASCHMAPTADSGHQPMLVTAANKQLVNRAHIEALYGQRGLVKLVAISPKVEEILSDGQKSILGSFSCCLVPPEDLSDPMRAGQAEAGTRALDLLRKVRQCPEQFWSVMRARVLERADQVTSAASPGAGAARKSAAREAVAKALDKARTASDVEFAMEKEALAKALKAALIPPQGDAPHKAAYFLMIPGASKVYAAYIRRLGKGNRASAR